MKTEASFTLKTHQIFPVHTKMKKFRNSLNNPAPVSHFGFVFEKTVSEITLSGPQRMITRKVTFQKAPFSMFSVPSRTEKEMADDFILSSNSFSGLKNVF